MRTSLFRPTAYRCPERGQTNIIVLVALSIFLLGFIGFAVDYSNLWFHRQTAQAAADAACQACAMDLLVGATTGNAAQGGFTHGTNFDCSAAPTAAPCQYAALNGYPAPGLTANTPSNEVRVTFPSSIPGATPPPANIAPVPYVQVNVIDRAQVFFSGLLTGNKTQDVGAVAGCGLTLAKAPIPIIVLNPTCSHAFEVSGSATLKIVGGPNKSVQVNSDSQTCAAATVSSAGNCGGNGTIDLSLGGPSYTGSNFGVFGKPTTVPTNFVPGTTGSWQSPASPIADPYSQVPAPTKVGLTARTGPATTVPYGTDGCPDQTNNCDLYLPGLYTQPIVVDHVTAIFVPGLYYIEPTSYPGASTGGGFCGNPGSGCTAGHSGPCRADFIVGTQGILRPATNLTGVAAAASDGSKGAVFYLSGSQAAGYGSVVFTSNAGSPGPRNVDSFSTAQLSCDGSSPAAQLNVPASLGGNILMAQCTNAGTYYQSGGPSTDTINATGVRGLLFFQDHANGDPNGQPNMQGGGGFALSGTIYVHDTTAHKAFLQLQGTPGSGTYLLGEIVSDQLVEAGNGSIAMSLNPNAVYFILKAELLR